MSGDVDSNLSYSAVVENMGVAVEISLIASYVCSKLSSTSGFSVRHVENIADKNIPKTPTFFVCRVLSNEPLCAQKFQVVPEIVRRSKNVRIKL